MKCIKKLLTSVVLGFLIIGCTTSTDEAPSLKDKNVAKNETPKLWKLPSENFIPAKMSMHLVYPQPDKVTGANARHKFAYPNLLYQIPMGVQGGAWPFHYELINGPSGATIGETHEEENYGVVSWLAASSGTYQFEVRITDQEDHTVTALWQVEVNADQFVFVQDGYTGEKQGSLSQPLEDLADWYKGDRSDDSYVDKIIVLRAGNYELIGGDATNGNVRLDTGSKTASFIAYPNEIPVVDCSRAKILTDDVTHDLFVAGIRWENGRQDVNNAHFFWAIGDVSRSTWWRNHFHNLGPGLVGNDNTTAVFISSTGVLKENILYKENRHTQINNFGYNGGYFEAYVSNYVLIEQNIASDSNVAYGFFPKGTRSYVSVRANQAYNNVGGTQITIGNGGEAKGLTHDHEICWNVIKAPNDNVLLFSGSAQYSGQSYNNHIYRNTIVGDTAWVRFPGKENYQVDGNIVITNDMNVTGSRWNQAVMDSAFVSNLLSDTAENIIDQNLNLIGEYRTQYLGSHGHEISFD
ncbi:MAG: hypothetical protein OEZ58_04605 [Gammaproteobacteria bacterium]|nr:hypothetical protein [Gammaproteobacteria bacterium]